MNVTPIVHVSKHQAYAPILIAAVVAILASFLSWGTYKFEGATIGDMFAEEGLPAPEVDASVGGGSYTVNVWRSSAPFFGAGIPNWFVMIAAGTIAILAAFGWQQMKSPYYSLAVLGVYGALHSGYWVYKMIESPAYKPGLGAFLTMFGFIGVLYFWFKLPAWLRN